MKQQQRRLFLILSLLVAGGALAFVSLGNIGENLVYYWNPTEVLEQKEAAYGATIRMGGVVKAGSLDWNENSNELNFELSDGTSIIKVHASGAPPEMFREGIGVLVEGTMVQGGTFESDRLMVKHSNEYKAPEEGKSVEELYETVENL